MRLGIEDGFVGMPVACLYCSQTDFGTEPRLLHPDGACSRRAGGGLLMRAILRTRFGGPDVLVIREIPEPEPKDGHAVIQVKAFGLNHAELHMRKGEWAEIADVS